MIFRPKLGRKERGGGKNQDDNQCVLIRNSYNCTIFQTLNTLPLHNSPDLAEPHILRSLSNVKVTSIHASSHGCHSIMLDVSGAAWMFGRNERASLGAAGREYISENAPIKLPASTLPGASPKTRFVHAACGRNHSLLIGSEGQVWSTGANNLGQCGHPPCPEVLTWQQVKGTFGGGRVVKAAAGITFSIVLTEQGRREWTVLIHTSPSPDDHRSVFLRQRRARSVGQRKNGRTHHYWKQDRLRRAQRSQ